MDGKRTGDGEGEALAEGLAEEEGGAVEGGHCGCVLGWRGVGVGVVIGTVKDCLEVVLVS